ncbi:maturation of 5S rRNA [Lithohypha guttulata]|nr:maturation of 5S rRNA [Lithohypha guttulata]
MWLINTETLSLEYFQICPVGQYAILSHRWQDEEVTFAEFQHDTKGASSRGFWKIEKCCQQARVQGLKYAWVDTCCIDKSSSAELSEAINSMFRWYADASQCYVYMVDVISETKSSVDDFTIQPWEELYPVLGYDTPVPVVEAQFCQSKWFRRGWTLQELLAPRDVLFFDKHWTYLGQKARLTSLIHEATAIDAVVLLSNSELLTRSVAQRMSWAANRKTTRLEDIAYSLLGIFDVNMPLLYGEGEKAFLRLQYAILDSSDDESLFAWTGVHEHGDGLLAPHPSHFAQAGEIDRDRSWDRPTAYSMTNKGINIQLDLMPYNLHTYLIPLRCAHLGFFYLPLGIVLCQTVSGSRYRRVRGENGDLVVILDDKSEPAILQSMEAYVRSDLMLSCDCRDQRRAERQSIYVSQTPLSLQDGRGFCRIVVRNCLDPLTNVLTVLAGETMTPKTLTDQAAHSSQTLRILTKKSLSIKHHQHGIQIPQVSFPFLDLAVKGITVGFDFDSRPMCMVFWDDTTAQTRESAWEQLTQHEVEYEERPGWRSNECINIELCKQALGDRVDHHFVADTFMGKVTVSISFKPQRFHCERQPIWNFSVQIWPSREWLVSFDDSRTEQRYSEARSTLAQAFKTRLSELTDGMSKQLKIDSVDIAVDHNHCVQFPILNHKYEAFIIEYLDRVEWNAGPGADTIPQQRVGV